MISLSKILEENNLELVESAFFRQKENIAKVKDEFGNMYFLKTGRIEPFQEELFDIAKSIESELCFRVPKIVKRGAGWILFEYVEGKMLNDFYDKKTDWCVEISERICRDYQKVIKELQNRQAIGNLFEEGKAWLESRLENWSKPIIEAGLLGSEDIKNLKQKFSRVVEEKGEDFFGWFHGNIIGDHILISQDSFYLVDLCAVPRMGKNYYDFLRALDAMFLKIEDEEKFFKAITEWTKKYLNEFDNEEIKLVMAFRYIGILGQDILSNNAIEGKGDTERKKQIALKFIKREY